VPGVGGLISATASSIPQPTDPGAGSRFSHSLQYRRNRFRGTAPRAERCPSFIVEQAPSIIAASHKATGIDPSRLGGRGIGIHSLRKTAINDAIRNGATMHEVREFAGHADIRTTEVYFVRKEEDAEVAARRIHIRVTGRKGE
jgi:integrase